MSPSVSRPEGGDETGAGLGIGLGHRFGQAHLATDGVDQRVRLGQHRLPLRFPGGAECLDDPAERGHPVAILGWEVGAGVERPAVGRAEHGHGPAARSGQRLGGRHVERVEVRALLPVDLDRDEPAGQVVRRRLVLEALVGHHMTPVAGRIADGQKDRLVLPGGLLEGLFAPGKPFDRVVRMLTEVRARFVRQMVHGSRCYGSAGCPPAEGRQRGKLGADGPRTCARRQDGRHHRSQPGHRAGHGRSFPRCRGQCHALSAQGG